MPETLSDTIDAVFGSRPADLNDTVNEVFGKPAPKQQYKALVQPPPPPDQWLAQKAHENAAAGKYSESPFGEMEKQYPGLGEQEKYGPGGLAERYRKHIGALQVAHESASEEAKARAALPPGKVQEHERWPDLFPPPYKQDWESKLPAGTDPEQIRGYRQGLVAALEKGERVNAAVQKHADMDRQDVLRYWAKRLPGVRFGTSLTMDAELRKHLEKIQAGTADELDYDRVGRALAAEKRSGMLGKPGDILSGLPAFGIEMAASGGAAAGLRGAVGGGLAMKAAATGAGYLPMAAGMTAEGTSQRMMPQFGLVPDEQGQLRFGTQEGKSLAEALPAAAKESFINLATVGTLGKVGALFGAFGKTKAGEFLNGYLRSLEGKMPALPQAFNQVPGVTGSILSHGGIAGQAGMPGMVDMRVAEALNYLSGAREDAGVFSQGGTEAMKHLASEALAFGIAHQIMGQAQRKGEKPRFADARAQAEQLMALAESNGWRAKEVRERMRQIGLPEGMIREAEKIEPPEPAKPTEPAPPPVAPEAPQRAQEPLASPAPSPPPPEVPAKPPEAVPAPSSEQVEAMRAALRKRGMRAQNWSADRVMGMAARKGLLPKPEAAAEPDKIVEEMRARLKYVGLPVKGWSAEQVMAEAAKRGFKPKPPDTAPTEAPEGELRHAPDLDALLNGPAPERPPEKPPPSQADLDAIFAPPPRPGEIPPRPPEAPQHKPPAVLEHGSRSPDIKSFDLAKAGENKDIGLFGVGVYLAKPGEAAKLYGPHQYEVRHSLQKAYAWPKDAGDARSEAHGTGKLPADIREEVLREADQIEAARPPAPPSTGWETFDASTPEGNREVAIAKAISNVLRRHGYDSVEYDNPVAARKGKRQTEYVALEPSKLEVKYKGEIKGWTQQPDEALPAREAAPEPPPAAPEARPAPTVEPQPADVVDASKGAKGGYHISPHASEASKYAPHHRKNDDDGYNAPSGKKPFEDYPEAKASLSDADIAAAAARDALPLPKQKGELDAAPLVRDAWELVSRLWPEMASRVKAIQAVDYGERKNVRGAMQTDGTLRLPISRPIDASFLWHELVHFHQGDTGKLNVEKGIKTIPRDRFLELEREANARQGQMDASGVWDRLQNAVEARQAPPAAPPAPEPAPPPPAAPEAKPEAPRETVMSSIGRIDRELARQQVLDLGRKGMSLRGIEKKLGIGYETVRTLQKEAKAAEGKAGTVAQEQAQRKAEAFHDVSQVAEIPESMLEEEGERARRELEREYGSPERVRQALEQHETFEQTLDKLHDKITERWNQKEITDDEYKRAYSIIAKGLENPNRIKKAELGELRRLAAHEAPVRPEAGQPVPPGNRPETEGTPASPEGHAEAAPAAAGGSEAPGNELTSRQIASLAAEIKDQHNAGIKEEAEIRSWLLQRVPALKGRHLSRNKGGRSEDWAKGLDEASEDAQEKFGRPDLTPDKLLEMIDAPKRKPMTEAEAVELAQEQAQGATDFPFGANESPWGMGAAGGGGIESAPPPGTRGVAGPAVPEAQRQPAPASAWYTKAADWLKSFGQQAFPGLTRLSRTSGEKLAQAANAPAAAKASWDYYSRILKVGGKALGDLSPEEARYVGAVWLERRFREYRDWLKRQGLRSDQVGTLVGQEGSPLATEADYQEGRQALWSFWEAVRQEWTPEVEKNFRGVMGLEPDDAIDSKSQIPGLPLNAIALTEAAPSQGVVGTGKRQGMENLRLRKPGFARTAELSAAAYDTDIMHMMQRTLNLGIPAGRRAEFVRTAMAEGVLKDVQYGDKIPDGWEETGLRPSKGMAGLDPNARYYAHPDAFKDIEQGLGIGKRPGQTLAEGLRPVMDKLYSFALMSPVELATHIGNHFTALFRSGMGVPGLNLLRDSFTNAYQLYKQDPEMLRRVMELAKIGASFSHEAKPGLLGEGLKRYDPTAYINQFSSKMIDTMQKAVRVQLDDAFGRLAKAGKVEDTETARRNFINQALGNYNAQAGNRLTQFLKDTGLQSFATAAHTFTVQGAKVATGGAINAPATSGRAAVQLRAEAMLKLLPVLAMGPVLNYLFHGNAFPQNVPAFAIQTRDDDQEGKTHFFDPLAFTGLRRGWRATGINAVIEGMREGKTSGEMLDKAVKDWTLTGEHLVAGPPAQFVHTALTGKDALGRQISERVSTAKTPQGQQKAAQKGMPEAGSSQWIRDLQAAGLGINPILKTATEPSKTPRTLWENLMQSAGPFGEKTRSKGKK